MNPFIFIGLFALYLLIGIAYAKIVNHMAWFPLDHSYADETDLGVLALFWPFMIFGTAFGFVILTAARAVGKFASILGRLAT